MRNIVNLFPHGCGPSPIIHAIVDSGNRILIDQLRQIVRLGRNMNAFCGVIPWIRLQYFKKKKKDIFLLSPGGRG